MYRSLMALIERVGDDPSGVPDGGALAGLGVIPEPLLRAVDEGECFLFAGENLSSSSGMAGWSQFLGGLIDYLVNRRILGREEANSLRDTWINGRYDRVADSIRKTVETSNDCAVRYATRLYSHVKRVSPTVEALAKVPFCGVVTPNLDGVLERVLHCEAFGPGHALNVEDRLAECVPFILKLRGLFGEPSLQVWQDLAIDNMRPDCAEALRELFRTRTMLAIGVTADDLQRWMDAAGIPHSDQAHYLIASSSDRELKRKAEILYRKFHVRVLASDEEDDEVLPFLHKLSAHHKLSN